MIRRSPTRLELKLDDIQDFEYVQKSDRKKVILSCTGTEEAKKLIRQERIGYTAALRTPDTHPTTMRGLTTTSSDQAIAGAGISTTSNSRRRHNAPQTVPIMQPRPSGSTPTNTIAQTLIGDDEDHEDEDLIGSDLEDVVTPYPRQNTGSISQDDMLLELSQAPQSDSEVPDDNLEYEEMPSDH